MSTRERTPEELRAQLDATRRELAATVEQLAAKTAVRARLHDRVERVKDDLTHPLRAAAIGGLAIVVLVGWTLSRHAD